MSPQTYYRWRRKNGGLIPSEATPEAYLANILGRIRILDPKRLDDLLPWEWKTDRDADQRAA